MSKLQSGRNRDQAEEQLACLRAALTEGERSGQPTAFDFEAFFAEKRAAFARSRETDQSNGR